jgi:hypothetical protein
MLIQTQHLDQAPVKYLSHQINPNVAPRYITITPEPSWALQNAFECVRRKVACSAGRIQAGWSIWVWPGVYLQAEHHAVYEPPAGSWLEQAARECRMGRRRDVCLLD